MYVIINSKIRNLILKCIKKAGTEDRLLKILNLPDSIYNYKTRSRTIPLVRLRKLIKFLNLDEKDFVYKSILLPHNWRQKIGGIKSFQSKVEKGTFKNNIKKMSRISSIRMKKIFEYQKKFHTEQYYKKQYERFKKIAQYKYSTRKGEKVRNTLEKNVADFLFQNNINYQYEPYVEGKNGKYFPDFLLSDRRIIECTMWRGFDKAQKLSNKIRDLEKKNFKIIVVVTPNVKRFFKKIDKYVVDDLKVLNNRLSLSHSSSD